MNYLKATKPRAILLYKNATYEDTVFNDLKKYLIEKIPDVEIIVEDNIIPAEFGSANIRELAEEFAKIKIRDLNKVNFEFEPLPGEIEFEKNNILRKGLKAQGILYDGFKLQRIYKKLISDKFLNFDYIHIIFTDRLISSFDQNDRRYHARAIICGYPSIISTSGIVEAPAKPKEFYRLKQKLFGLGNSELLLEELKTQFKGRFIDYDDSRIIEVLKGYVMQSIFYHLTGSPFCEDKSCRLFNAHWQEEMIEAQIGVGELCLEHQKILDQW